MRALSAHATRGPDIGDFRAGLLHDSMIVSGSRVLSCLHFAILSTLVSLMTSGWLQPFYVCYANSIQRRESSFSFSICRRERNFSCCFPVDFPSGPIGWNLVTCVAIRNRTAMVGLDQSRIGSLAENGHLNSFGGLMLWKTWGLRAV